MANCKYFLVTSVSRVYGKEKTQGFIMGSRGRKIETHLNKILKREYTYIEVDRETFYKNEGSICIL
jgi:hypothetical protein